MLPRPRFVVPLPDGRTLELGGRTLVMGVLNVTPDSFSDGGRYADPARAIEAGVAMAQEGADLIDVGGESTRPGAAPVSADEEQRRVIPVIRALARRTHAVISIDTYKAETARAALEAGAVVVNDISGLQFDPALADVVASRGAAVVLMHTRGRPDVMTSQAAYGDVIREVAAELRVRLDTALARGIAPDAVILDPGLGFAKRAEHSAQLLARLDAAPLAALGRPWLVGPSRKSFLQAAIGECEPADREWATAGAVAVAACVGAHIVRVHRVCEMRQVARVVDLLRAAR